MPSPNRAIFEEIARVLRDGGARALASVVATKGSTPGKTTMRMLVRPDGSCVGSVGGGCVEAEVVERGLQVIRDERPQRFSVALNEHDHPETGLICGGRIEILVEPIVMPNVYLFGAGHVARAICALGAALDFRFVVVDDREALLTKERFPDAAERRVLPLAAAAERLSLTADDYALVLTRGHRQDLEVLRGLSRHAPRLRYLGMIGSKAKRRSLLARLAAEGIDEELLERVRTPIGLDIGAVTAEEIAVSVLAELVAVRRRGDAGGPPEPA